MDECQEPRCKHSAAKIWGGRKVCQDHYEEYQEAHDRQLQELNKW